MVALSVLPCHSAPPCCLISPFCPHDSRQTQTPLGSLSLHCHRPPRLPDPPQSVNIRHLSSELSEGWWGERRGRESLNWKCFLEAGSAPGWLTHWGQVSRALTLQGIGEACTQHDQCQSHCCATNSLNPQKFCSPQTIFLHCMSWLKVCPNWVGRGGRVQRGDTWPELPLPLEGESWGPGRKDWVPLSWQPDRHTCSDHSECQSSCCVTNSHRAQMFCAPRTIFLQWVPWRKVRARGAGTCPAWLCWMVSRPLGPAYDLCVLPA